tara:strand:+ start:166728 stop:167354 length:627 start_codon:yes stop_codon:yes gene_type:complete
MGLKSKLIYTLFVVLFSVNAYAAARSGIVEWRVESSFPKLEKAPAYAHGSTPFPVRAEPPKPVKVVKVEVPKELSESQKRALQAADILSEIRQILNDKDIFNADTSEIIVEAIIQADGNRSALIKNRWYENGGVIDVPIVAKEHLLSLVDVLSELDESLAEIVEAQVNEKIELVHNLSLTVQKINENSVEFVDAEGKTHVIKFKVRSF